MQKIKLLPPKIRNFISAGEVILRPASVVKELLENSLDSGAKKIELHIKNGGLDGISVIDDGCGINQSDLQNAISPHYTSKIIDFDDVFKIDTFGYRGEALASIASVSSFSLSSAVEGSECGWNICSDINNQVKITPTTFSKGTNIEVRDLFFSVPVRRSFMRGIATEYAYCEEYFVDYALCFFNVEFKFVSDGKTIFHLPACETIDKIKERVALLISDDFTKNCITITHEKDGLKLEGLLGLPNVASRRISHQHFYVNDRPVRENILNAVIKEELADIIYGSYYLPYILNFTIDYDQVDVNIHPQKSQVRYRNFEKVRGFFASSFREVYASLKPQNFQQPITLLAKNRIMPEVSNQGSLPRLDLYADETAIENVPIVGANFEIKSGEFTFGEPIATIDNTYLVAKNSLGLVLVEIHAASERIIFEELKKLWDTGSVSQYAQKFLMPEKLNLSPSQAQNFLKLKEPMFEIGLEVSQSAPTIFLIHSAPVFLDKFTINDVKELITLILDTSSLEAGVAELKIILNEKLGDMACKKAIKSGTAISIDQQRELLKRLASTPRGNQCNHGRPTWIQLDTGDLDYIFSRGK